MIELEVLNLKVDSIICFDEYELYDDINKRESTKKIYYRVKANDDDIKKQ